MQFSEKAKEEYQAILARYPRPETAVIAVLDLAQREFGSVSEESERYLSELMGVHLSQIHAAATFYTMFNKQPTGKHHIQVCRNLSCSLLGAEHIIDYLQKTLGIPAGGTTEDGVFTLSTVECLGSCGTAPMMQIDDTYYENLTPEKVDEVINELRGGEKS
jgi:NADH-quinone oxidoreductase subunit E